MTIFALWANNSKRGENMENLSNISVVLPSLDPDEKLTAVVDGLLEYGFSDIILVNDGSKPENLHFFTDAARKHPEVTLLTHEVNRGKGAAMKTAFAWFLQNRPDGLGVITVDGDNQHHPADTRACCEKMLETGHCVLGCRDFNQEDVPPRSRFGNKTTSLVFKFFVVMTLSDTQTGLRAIPRKDLEILSQVSGDRYEYETNTLLAMKDNAIPFEEVKIRTVYIEDNASSHFHPIRDSWRIYKLILSHFFRYTVSSLACAVVDTGAAAALNSLFLGTLSGFALTAATEAGARVLSSLLNFYLNKKLVFQTKVSTGKAMLRYYCLALPQMAAQLGLTHGFIALMDISDRAVGLRTLIHVVVMCVLYIISYMIQQRWVFAPEKNSDA